MWDPLRSKPDLVSLIFVGFLALVYYCVAFPIILVADQIVKMVQTIKRWRIRKWPIVRKNGIDLIHFPQKDGSISFNWKGVHTCGSVHRRTHRDRGSMRVFVYPKYGFQLHLAEELPNVVKNFRSMQKQIPSIYKELCFPGTEFTWNLIASMDMVVERRSFDQWDFDWRQTDPNWKQLTCYRNVFRLHNTANNVCYFLTNFPDIWPDIQKEICVVSDHFIANRAILSGIHF